MFFLFCLQSGTAALPECKDAVLTALSCHFTSAGVACAAFKACRYIGVQVGVQGSECLKLRRACLACMEALVRTNSSLVHKQSMKLLEVLVVRDRGFIEDDQIVLSILSSATCASAADTMITGLRLLADVLETAEATAAASALDFGPVMVVARAALMDEESCISLRVHAARVLCVVWRNKSLRCLAHNDVGRLQMLVTRYVICEWMNVDLLTFC